jgi:hypothetical protein
MSSPGPPFPFNNSAASHWRESGDDPPPEPTSVRTAPTVPKASLGPGNTRAGQCPVSPTVLLREHPRADEATPGVARPRQPPRWPGINGRGAAWPTDKRAARDTAGGSERPPGAVTRCCTMPTSKPQRKRGEGRGGRTGLLPWGEHSLLLIEEHQHERRHHRIEQLCPSWWRASGLVIVFRLTGCRPGPAPSQCYTIVRRARTFAAATETCARPAEGRSGPWRRVRHQPWRWQHPRPKDAADLVGVCLGVNILCPFRSALNCCRGPCVGLV